MMWEQTSTMKRQSTCITQHLHGRVLLLILPCRTSPAVKDLNEDPTLPYDDNTFDIITNAVSVDYLNKPREVLQPLIDPHLGAAWGQHACVGHASLNLLMSAGAGLQGDA